MSERLVGRCDCGHLTYLLSHREWCPCQDCHPDGRLYPSDPSGASVLGRRTLRRAPRERPRGSPRGSRGQQEAGASVEDWPPLDPDADAELVLGLTQEEG